MTEQEFQKILLPAIAETFPEVCRWIGENRQVIAAWVRSLERIDAAQAAKTFHAWLDNGTPFRHYATEWQDIPRHLREACRTRSTPEYDPEQFSTTIIDRRQVFGPIGLEVLRLADDMKHGRIERGEYQNRKSLLMEQYLACLPKDDVRQAVRCLTCQDKCWVSCWDWSTVAAVRDNLDYIPHYTMAVHCSCQLSWNRYPGQKDRKPCAYNQRKFCRVLSDDPVADVTAWLEWRRNEGMQQHPNYENDFVEFAP
jgi:hypothetical protein